MAAYGELLMATVTHHTRHAKRPWFPASPPRRDPPRDCRSRPIQKPPRLPPGMPAVRQNQGRAA
jgi:hypothetical protein